MPIHPARDGERPGDSARHANRSSAFPVLLQLHSFTHGRIHAQLRPENTRSKQCEVGSEATPVSNRAEKISGFQHSFRVIFFIFYKTVSPRARRRSIRAPTTPWGTHARARTQHTHTHIHSHTHYAIVLRTEIYPYPLRPPDFFPSDR